jgi:hypothetical protein
MNDFDEAIDFQQLAEALQDPEQQCGATELAIWGGDCSEADILTLLQQWPGRDNAMLYRIWEYSSQILFEDANQQLPTQPEWLERGRLFGSGGDLSLRRHEKRFRWHFIGLSGTTPPTGNFNAQSFWDVETTTVFHRRNESGLLWGERQTGFDLWFEDRTARAELKYPTQELGRIQVHYETFSRAGRVEFVWLQRLSRV